MPRELIRETYDALWRRRGDLLRVAAVPVAVTLAIDAVLFFIVMDRAATDGGGPGAVVYLLLALSIPPTALLAVNWLRVLLLGPGAVAGLGARWGRRETGFLLRMLVILAAGLLAAFIVVAPVSAVVSTLAGAAGSAVLGYWLGFAALLGGMLVYAYVALRLSPALAALAIDRAATLGQAWTATRGHGGRFVLAGIGVVAPFYVLTLLLPALLIQTGIDQVVPLTSLLLQVLLAAVTSAAGFTLVAMIFRWLARGSGLQTAQS